MENKKMTIKEIASLSGVSQTAVSFVLNERPGVSESTREKVQSVIRMTNYTPNAASQRLTMKKSFNIALIYPSLASPFTDMFYCEVADGLTEELTKAHYNAVFCPFSEAQLNDAPQIIRRQDADGAVFLQRVGTALLDQLDEQGFPYVLLDIHETDEKHTNVSFDCESFLYGAVEYLVGRGHSNIAFWGLDILPSYYLRCFTGYQKALSHFRLPLETHWIQHSSDLKESVLRGMKRLWEGEKRPTAVCCTSDMLAALAMNAARELGIGVPEELSFIGVDDIILSEYIEPPLTTVNCRKRKMGRLAAQLLLRKINLEEADTEIIREFHIVERQSVRTPEAVPAIQ